MTKPKTELLLTAFQTASRGTWMTRLLAKLKSLADDEIPPLRLELGGCTCFSLQFKAVIVIIK